MLTKKLKNVSFYQKTRGTFWSRFREKLSQSWRKNGPVFLPYDPCRCWPSRTVFDQKYTQFPFVWWSKNMEHFCIFKDFYNKKWSRIFTNFIRTWGSVKVNRSWMYWECWWSQSSRKSSKYVYFHDFSHTKNLQMIAKLMDFFSGDNSGDSSRRRCWPSQSVFW